MAVMNNSAAAQDELDSLFVSPDSTAVLCGAGISFASGVPLANTVKEMMVLALLGKADCKYSVNELLNCSSTLPFESFIELILRNLSSRVQNSALIPPNADDLGYIDSSVLNRVHESFFNVFRVNSPSRTHMFLARLMEQKTLLHCVTTNFDTLIEQAFDYQQTRRLKVLCDELEYDERKHLAAVESLLIKIHGSVDRLSTVRTTLDGIADPERRARRESVIHELFASGTHSSVLIIGYSCSDVFDINPAIEAASFPRKRVVIVRHDPHIPLSSATLLPIRSCPPFGKYEGVVIVCNTDEIVDNLAKRLCVELPSPFSRPTVSADYLAEIVTSPTRDKYFALFEICYHSGAMTEAVYFGKKAVAAAEADRCLLAIARAYGNLANAQIQNGDANGAAISIKKSEDAGGNGVSFNSIHILLSQGNFPVALQKYKELAHTERDPLLIAMALAGGAHVANGMGRFSEAEQLAKEAITSLGHLPATTMALTCKIQSLLYFANACAGLGRTESFDLLKQARKEANCLHNPMLLGHVMLMHWKMSMILHCFDEMQDACDEIVEECSTDVLQIGTMDFLRSMGMPNLPTGAIPRSELNEIFVGIHLHFMKQLNTVARSSTV